MVMNRGLFVRPIEGPTGEPVGTDAVEARRALGGLISGPGVLSIDGQVSGVSGSWAYSLPPLVAATERGNAGLYVLANDAPMEVLTDPAPGTGSRIDIIWVKQNDADLGDPDVSAIADVARGTASGTPVPPSIPAGATEIARAVVSANDADTMDATITQGARAHLTGSEPASALWDRGIDTGGFGAGSTADSTFEVVTGLNNRHTNGVGYGNGVFTIQTPGVYLVSASVAFGSNGTGQRAMRLLINGTERAHNSVVPSQGAVSAVVPLNFMCALAPGDNLTFETYQSSGGSLDRYVDGSHKNWWQIQKVGSL